MLDSLPATRNLAVGISISLPTEEPEPPITFFQFRGYDPADEPEPDVDDDWIDLEEDPL
jgi:hypothetical protein